MNLTSLLGAARGLDLPLGAVVEAARATQAYEALDAEQFTDLVQAYDEVSRLDPQKTTLLLVSGQPG